MTKQELLELPQTKELRQALTELELVSHVRGVSYDSSGGGKTGDDLSGALPPGGIDQKGDRQDEYRQKSAYHFLIRWTGLLQAQELGISDERIHSILEEILSDARAALRDWRKTPKIPGRDPDWGTFEWKVRVANDSRSSRVVAGAHGISHVTVLRYRRDYAGL